MDAHLSLPMPLEWETSVLSTNADETSGGPAPDPAHPPAPIPAAKGRIGKYEITGLLGKGAMGAVYRAFDPVLERDVALKVMLARVAEDPENRRRFEREARAVARMSHPNVVTVFDLGYHTDGSPYIVMELLKGRDLLHVLRARPEPSLERKLAISLEVLEGLGHAHRAGIVHRDIKPANIFVNEGGTAKITDFGVAHLPATSETTSGMVVGTANYMSPEQVLGRRFDGRSDLFSVGCMLGEMLTGRPPFEAETPVATLYRVAYAEPRLPLPAGPEYERLRPVLARALAKPPDERYATCEELLADLRRCLDSFHEAPSPAPHVSLPPVDVPKEAPRPSAPQRPPDPAGICARLREIHVGRRSGHLHFSHADEHRSLRLVQGRIVHGTSDAAGEHLGDVLVRYGHLSQADLERAVVSVLGERKRLGAVLGEMGLIGPEALAAAVGEHVREILFGALERPDASCTFEEMTGDAPEADLTCELSTAEAILEATRRVHDLALIERALGDMNRVLVPATDRRLRDQKVALTPTDGFVLSRIDGTLSAREILSLVPGPREDAARSLFGLLCTGLVDYSPSSPARPVPSAARHARQTPSVPVVETRRPAPPPPPAPAPPAPPPRTEARPLPTPPREPQEGTDDGRQAAHSAFAEATSLFKREKYWDAVQLLEPAIPRLETPTRHRALVLLARVYLKNPHWSRRAEAALQRVVSEDPRHVDAHFLLGGLYSQTQLKARAAAMFRKVLEVQPGHPGALEGLRALEPPKERPRLAFLKKA
jgi:serine/threonine protein kinase